MGTSGRLGEDVELPERGQLREDRAASGRSSLR
jgi:hypothetical protein